MYQTPLPRLYQDVRLKKKEKGHYFYFLIIIMVVLIYTSAMILPFNVAAITTLDRLDFERNRIEQNVPHFNVGDSPVDIAVDDSINEIDDSINANTVYVANEGSGTVSVIDVNTLNVSSVTVGESPGSMAIDDFNNVVYVANSDSDTVSVIDVDTLKVSSVTVGGFPRAIAIDEESNIAYVANGVSGTVSVIDERAGNFTNIANVTVSADPIDIAVVDGKAYVADSDSGIVSVIDERRGNFTNIGNITVGKYPTDIAVAGGKVYVVNEGSNTVSVIDGTNVENITVGESPRKIAHDETWGVVYVANGDSGTVSVIDTINDKNLGNISVGEGPYDIAVAEAELYAFRERLAEFSEATADVSEAATDVSEAATDIAVAGEGKVYVVNEGSNTVSVIDTISENFTNIANVTVGEHPVSVAVDEDRNIAYVANRNSDTVSVLYGPSQQAGVSFDVSPAHAGRLECGNITVPTNQYIYVDFRTQCTAQANQGFQFNSWIENLGSNSSRTISTSQGDWFMNGLDWFTSALSGERRNLPETLNVTKFGSFTANFEKSPPAIPPEYLATIFAVVASAFIGSWLTPTFIGWRKAKKQGNKLDYYHEKIQHVYADDKLDKNDIGSLDKLRDKITDEYARGKMNEEQFDKLVDDISICYQEISRKEIDSVMIAPSKRDKIKELNQIKYDIEDACAKGKISELHYNLLNKKIESFVNTNENKTKLQGATLIKRSPI